MLSISKNPDTGLYETSIDGKKYDFAKWGADEAVDVMLDLIKISGKPLASAIAGMMSKDREVAAANMDAIGDIVGALTDRLDKVLCKQLIKKFSSEKVWCDGAVIRFDSHYQDRLDIMFLVIRAALEVQYGNFLGAFLGATGIKLPTKMAPISNRVPTT